MPDPLARPMLEKFHVPFAARIRLISGESISKPRSSSSCEKTNALSETPIRRVFAVRKGAALKFGSSATLRSLLSRLPEKADRLRFAHLHAASKRACQLLLDRGTKRVRIHEQRNSGDRRNDDSSSHKKNLRPAFQVTLGRMALVSTEILSGKYMPGEEAATAVMARFGLVNSNKKPREPEARRQALSAIGWVDSKLKYLWFRLICFPFAPEQHYAAHSQ